MNYIKIFLSTVFIFSTLLTAFSQDITLTTQAEVDAFDQSITIIKGNLFIGERRGSNTDIKNLDGLSGLTTVGGDLEISNSSLTSLSGLSGLTTVGRDLVISRNYSLTSLSGLSGLTTVGEYLEISDDPSLTNLSGLSGLTTVGYLIITYNPSLTNLSGLSGLTAVGENLVISDNPFLTSLSSLSGLTTIGGDLEIYNNSSLMSLFGLSGLTTVGGELSIYMNNSLTSLSGLSGFTTVGGNIYIANNNSLTDCCSIQSLLSKDGAIKGKINIEKNATTCDSKEIILSSCSDEPNEGAEISVPEIKENLYSLTRWELKSCDNSHYYKFTKEGKVTKNGTITGTYEVNQRNLTITLNGTAQTYTVSKMTRNAMHLNDAAGNETVYGRKRHFSVDNISGTNWKEKKGIHSDDDMRIKFIDDRQAEFITIGQKGSKLKATYSISSDEKKMTIQFEDEAKAKEQGFLIPTKYDVVTFNFMMMKIVSKGEECLYRTK